MHRLPTHLLAAVALIFVVPAVGTAQESKSLEGPAEPFLGEPRFEKQDLFEGGRFPNVVVATDGTILATWGKTKVGVRRSTDGGRTWGPEIPIGPGIHGGGAIVDEGRGNVLVFTHPKHPPTDGEPAPRTVHRSTDHGLTWKPLEATFEKDAHAFLPALHMSEHGLTLRHGPHAGRLVRPARVYRQSPERYSDSIYSDDGGETWQASEPVPVQGCGEGALLELSDGRLVYTARRSFFADGEKLRHERHMAISTDGGAKWGQPGLFAALPDGPAYRGTDRRGSNYNGHFGMLAGFVRLPIEGRDVLLYSNADHDGHERQRLTVWASFDGGKTWPVKRLVEEGPSAYSSLAAGRPDTPSEGAILLQYEYGAGRNVYVGGRIARFNLAWLAAGKATGDGDLPEWIAANE